MKTVTHQSLRLVIKKAYYQKIPLFIWGPTGIGKSETVRDVAQELARELKLVYQEDTSQKDKFSVIDVRLSQFDPSDLRGIPSVVEGRTQWAYPDWLPREGQGILFLDELNLAPPLIQASAYQLILDRRLGSYKLPEGWGVVAAGNREEDRAYAFEMSGPLCNRFIHLELQVPDIQTWTQWAVIHQVDPRVITFLNFKPYLYRYDTQTRDKTFPTPRGWAKYVSPLISGITDYNHLHTLIASVVGEGVATECIAYLKLSQKLDVEKILETPEKIREITEIDLKYTIVSALTEKVRANSQKYFERVCLCSEYLEPEFAILLLRMIKPLVKNIERLVEQNPKIISILNKYSKYLLDIE